MKNKIIDFFKGFGIGISNLIPGFSGGTAAVILCVYDRFVGMFDGIVTKPKETLKDCWALLVGLIIGVVVGIVGIVKLIAIFPVQTAFFISGLVIASYPSVIKSIRNGVKMRPVDIISFILAAIIIAVLPFLNQNIDNETFNIFIPFLLLFLGALCAAAMVVPGLSGALILMVFGYFIFVMNHINHLISCVTTFNFEGFGLSLLIVGSFFIGVVIGLVLISKFLKAALVKWPKTVYMAIFGILIASPFAIFWLIYHTDDYLPKISTSGVLSYIIASLMFFVGIFLVYFLPIIVTKKHTKDLEQENIDE